MKLLLIMPDAHMHKLIVGPFVRSMREAPLTLTTLAALAGAVPDVKIRLVDGSIDPTPLNAEADLVGISAITGCAPAAYDLARHYRQRGIPVVLGGVHVTVLPGEALEHADAIVVGRGEHAWPELLRDFHRGQMKRVYREHELADDVLADVPAPRRDLQRMSGYMIPNSIQATRGCKRQCDFCSVSAVWPRYYRRPVADVIRDIRAIPDRMIAFNDVSLVDDIEYSRELFTAMIPLRKKWGGLVTADSMQNSELLELMVRSGCVYLLIGFESDDQATLANIHKNFNQSIRYKDLIARLHGYGISVQGCFVFGFDHDDRTVFDSTIELVQELKVDIPRFSLYTPYPGTPLFERLMKEKRIISYNWNDYDTMHVVIEPAQMTPEELFAGFKRAYRDTFTLNRIVQRTARFDMRCPINFVGNCCYRIFVRRLYHEARFARPYSISDPRQAPAPHHWQIPTDCEEALCASH
jgi:radical SAM superfamily enzyme YgiQ (UPF0313 family)